MFEQKCSEVKFLFDDQQKQNHIIPITLALLIFDDNIEHEPSTIPWHSICIFHIPRSYQRCAIGKLREARRRHVHQFRVLNYPSGSETHKIHH